MDPLTRMVNAHESAGFFADAESRNAAKKEKEEALRAALDSILAENGVAADSLTPNVYALLEDASTLGGTYNTR